MPISLNWRAPAYRFYDERLAGRRTFSYLDSLLQSQWQSPEEIRAFQWGELQRLLRHAYDHTRFHRRRFEALGLTPEDIRTPEEYARLPILEKAHFAQHADDLLADNVDPNELTSSGSGGSTGAPMRYKHDRNSYEWRQACHMRGDLWAGATFGGPEFHLWGEQLKPTTPVRDLKRKLWFFALNLHFASTFRMSEEAMAQYAEEYNRLRPQVVVGFAYSLYLFARYLQREGKQVWRPRGIVITAEKIEQSQRESIEATFGAPVYDRYGSREVMLIAQECQEQRGLHVVAENLYVEVLKGGRPAAPGELGEVVVTDLHNYAMPFLRYRIGDLAVPSDRRCACGRGLPLLEEIRGRTVDVLRTPEGRTISGLFVPHLFKDHAWIEEFQVEQHALDRMDVSLKTTGAYRPELLEDLRQDLRQWFGTQVCVEFRVVDAIPRTMSGKHRPVISHVPAEGEHVARV